MTLQELSIQEFSLQECSARQLSLQKVSMQECSARKLSLQKVSMQEVSIRTLSTCKAPMKFGPRFQAKSVIVAVNLFAAISFFVLSLAHAALSTQPAKASAQPAKVWALTQSIETTEQTEFIAQRVQLRQGQPTELAAIHQVEYCANCPRASLSENVAQGAFRLYDQFRVPLDQIVVVYDYSSNLTYALSIGRSQQSENRLRVHGVFVSSGGRGGVSNRIRSGGTPLGVHRIYLKQGHGFAVGQTFDAAKYGFFETVIQPTQGFEDWTSDFVLTRLLRLRGLEGSLNNNSDARKILFHGTPEEGFLGYHESAGCIRLSNNEMVALFDLVQEGTLVNIVADDPRPKRVPRHLLVPIVESTRPELKRIRR